MPGQLLFFSQSEYLIKVDTNAHVWWQTVCSSFNSADSDQLAFFKSQLIWMYTVCKGRACPGSAGPQLKCFLKYDCTIDRHASIQVSYTMIWQLVWFMWSVYTCMPQHQNTYMDMCPKNNSDQPLHIATDRVLFSSEKCWYLSYYYTKTYVVGTH